MSVPAPGATVPVTDWDVLVDELDVLLDADAAGCAAKAVAAVDAARAAGDVAAEMTVLCYAAWAHHHLGEDAAALEAATRSEELARAQGDLVVESRALACRGLVHHELGDVEDAVDLLRRAVDLRREADDPAGTAEVLNHLGAVYLSTPHLAPRAAQVLTSARRLWLSAGDTDRASIALTNLARTYVVTGSRLAEDNPRAAVAAARQALELARDAVDEADAAGLSRTAVDARLAVVGALLLADDLDAAGAAIRGTQEMLDRFPTTAQQIVLHRHRSRWLARTGDHVRAAEEAVRGLELCDHLTRPGERVHLLRALVTAHEGAGDTVAALAALHDLHDLTVRLHDAAAERRAVLLSSRLEVEQAERAAEAERRRAEALAEHNARLAHEATHDALTGLVNRRALDAVLAEWVTERPRFAVALVDVDHFKEVNDRWSHHVGDQVLTRLGGVLRHALRHGDVAARYGGEEFAVLVDGADGHDGVEVAERIRLAVARASWSDLVPGRSITVSVGVAASTVGDHAVDLLERADQGLYRAKSTGRDRVCLG